MYNVNSLLSNFFEVWETSLAKTPLSKVISDFSTTTANRDFYGRGQEPEGKVGYLVARITQSLVVLRYGFPPVVWNHILSIPTPVLFDVCFITSAMSSTIVRENQDSDLVRYSWFYNFAMRLAMLMHPKDEFARLGYIEQLIDLSGLAPDPDTRPIFMNEDAIMRGTSSPIIH